MTSTQDLAAEQSTSKNADERPSGQSSDIAFHVGQGFQTVNGGSISRAQDLAAEDLALFRADERPSGQSGDITLHVGQGLAAVNGGSITVGQIHYHGQQSEAFKKSLLASLGFAQMAHRENSIDEVHHRSGTWLLRSAQYLRWSLGETQRSVPLSQSVEADGEDPSNAGDSRYAILWIIGNAGAGKSSLMKMAVDDARAKYEEALVLAHFFNARGTPQEKSSEGMYRTLLYWLVESLPAASTDRLRSNLGPVLPRVWTTPQLIRLLKAALREHGDKPTVFFVDALDECNEGDVQDILKVFRDLARRGSRPDSSQQQGKVRICFASRPFPHFGFHDAVFLDLDEQEGHHHGIMAYIDDELQISKSDIAEWIRQRVKQKSKGIFMWVVLVVETLNKAYNRGSMNQLQEQIEAIPSGLHELYSHLLERYPEDVEALLACIRCILFWLAPREGDTTVGVKPLWWAVQLGLGREDDEIYRDWRLMSIDDMKRQIIHITKGFVDFRGWPKDAARLVHESVQEFFLKDSELQRLYGVDSYDDFEAQSHEKLRDCCTAELEARRPALHKLLERKGQHNVTLRDVLDLSYRDRPSSGDEPDFPYLYYAREYSLEHAELAQQASRDQSRFLIYFVQQVGPLFSVFFSIQVRTLSSASERDLPSITHDQILFSSLISVLIVRGSETLIRETQLDTARYARQRGEAFGLVDGAASTSPIYLAIRNSETYNSFSKTATAGVSALLQLYLQLDSEKRHPTLQQILQKLANSWNGYSEFEPEQSGIALLQVASCYPLLATFFLIAMAPLQALVPHLSTMERIIEYDPESLKFFMRSLQIFVRTLKLFVDEEVPSDAMNFAEPGFLSWLSYYKREAAPRDSRETGSTRETYDTIEFGVVACICAHIYHQLTL